MDYMLIEKATIVVLTVGLIKKDSINEWIFSGAEIFTRRCES